MIGLAICLESVLVGVLVVAVAVVLLAEAVGLRAVVGGEPLFGVLQVFIESFCHFIHK